MSEVLEYIEQTYPEAMKMDDFDDCIIGVCHQCGQPTVIAYDQDKVIQKLMDRDGMDYEEAMEYFQYNQVGAYVGVGTPCFVEILK